MKFLFSMSNIYIYIYISHIIYIYIYIYTHTHEYTSLDDKYIIGMLYKLFVFSSFSVSQYRLSKTVSLHIGYCHAPYFGVVTKTAGED